MDSSGHWNDTLSLFTSGTAEQGAVLYSASASSISLESTTMLSSNSRQGGGCVFLSSMRSFRMRNNTLLHCRSLSGGGGALQALPASLLSFTGVPYFRVEDSLFADCQASGSGGALLIPLLLPVELVRTRVERCISYLRGGGIAVVSSEGSASSVIGNQLTGNLNLTLDSCVVQDNRALQGGGIFLDIGGPRSSGPALLVLIQGDALRLVNNTARAAHEMTSNSTMVSSPSIGNVAPAVGGGLYLHMEGASDKDKKWLEVAAETMREFLRRGLMVLQGNGARCGTENVGSSFWKMHPVPPPAVEPGETAVVRVDLEDAFLNPLCTADFFVASMTCQLCTPQQQSLHSFNGSFTFRFQVTSPEVSHGQDSVSTTMHFDDLGVDMNITARVRRCDEGKGFFEGS